MKLAMVGLGKMGSNMVRRLMLNHHELAVYDINPAAGNALREEGATTAQSLEDLVTKLEPRRVVWVMLPAGTVTESTLIMLAGLLQPGDIIIDGGNSNFKDSMRRAGMLAEKELHFIDVGTSGGVWGLKEGYSMMIGGPEEAINYCRPIFEALAPSPATGWGRVGPSGAGHYAKMVHNGIEYGLMQSYAEGFAILHARQDLIRSLAEVARIWQTGSVVRSWLLDLTAEALAEDDQLTGIEAFVPDSGEGRWTVADAIDLDVPAPVITLSLIMRLASRQADGYANKLLAVMRNKFGGHAVVKK
jgi:6-phosphogluconate dehydrogenase